VRRRFVLMMCLALPLAAFAKDQPTFQIEVVGTDAWERDLAIQHAATAGTANTVQQPRRPVHLPTPLISPSSKSPYTQY
jgi:hypothetical protein